VTKKSNQKLNTCPCCSGDSFKQCCQPYLLGLQLAPTAEKLMRSRYCAYVFNEVDYLLATWHESTRPINLTDEELNSKWISLKILAVEQGEENDNVGAVEFIAKYKVKGKAYRLHEISEFIKNTHGWVYLKGKVN